MLKIMHGLPTAFVSNRGQILLLVALSMILFVGLTALVTDVGYLYFQKDRLTTAVNAGYKAGLDRMMELGGPPLDDAKRASIRARVLEVMGLNGYSPAELTSINVIFPGNISLEISDNKQIGLFFASIVNFRSASVGAGRSSRSDGIAVPIPLAIPFGLTKDIDKVSYSVSLFPTNGTADGFIPGTEYILKLGGSDPGDPPDTICRIYVPMDAQSTSNNSIAYCKAYGVVHWALGQPNYVPVEWLIGYHGGAFMFRYYTDADSEAAKKYSILKARLDAKNISYQILTATQANAKYDEVDRVRPVGQETNIIRLSYQPVIHVYSSQSEADPVEQVLIDAEIPYGGSGSGASFVPYKLALGTKTTPAVFNSNSCHQIFDNQILSGEFASQAHWLHLHHEDFTGNHLDISNPTWGGTSTDKSTAVSQGFQAQTSPDGVPFTSYQVKKQEIAYKIRSFVESGHMMYTACLAAEMMDTALWMRRVRLGLTDPYRDCQAFTGFQMNTTNMSVTGKVVRIEGTNAIVAAVNPRDFSTDEVPVVYTPGYPAGSTILVDGKVTSVTTTKATFKVSDPPLLVGTMITISRTKPTGGKYKVGDIVTDYPYVNTTTIPGTPALNSNYTVSIPVYVADPPYTTINTSVYYNDSEAYSITNSLDPRQQDHRMTDFHRFWGYTTAFRASLIKPSVNVLGYCGLITGPSKKYLSGKIGDGEFAYMGGHGDNPNGDVWDIYGMRLTLNNVLLGSLVAERINRGGGGRKLNTGIIDPTNEAGGTLDQYLNSLKYGIHITTQINDRIIPLPGIASAATASGVDYRVNGDPTGSPPVGSYPRVIIPITDLGPEITQTGALNATATSIYDLQGQDDPNGVYASSSYNFKSAVRIIGYAEFELIPLEDATDADRNLIIGGPQDGQVRGRFIRYIVKPYTDVVPN
ncbi:MAG: pilus assembly protein TadG-related protein [Candidatus Ozemobacteraceae bacterium]